MQLHTKRFRLFEDGRLEVYDHRLATRLNRHLKRYDNGEYTIQEGEEAVFFLSQIETIDVLSKFLSKSHAHSGYHSTTLGASPKGTEK